MSEPTSDGKRLIEAWLSAAESVRHNKSRLRSAECDLENTHDTLAKWLLPDDVKPGEKIAVWHGDSLIQVEAGASGYPNKHIVTVRTRGKRGVSG